MSWNDGGEYGGDAGAVGGLGPRVGEAADSGHDSGIGAPSIGGYSPGDLSGGLGDIEAGIAADESAVGGWDFGTPPGGWGVNVAGPSVNTRGQISGAHHAGTAADSFAEAIDALDAAIGAMPDISTNAPPSTGLPGMGYSSTVGYNENFDPMGSSHMGQYGQGSGVAAYGGPGQTMGTGIGGVMSGIASPGLGYGTGALGEMGAAAPTGIGNPMGYGMDARAAAGLMGPGGVGTGAPGGPNQNQAAGVGGPSVSNVGAASTVGNALDSSAEYGGMQALGPGTQGTGAPGGPGQNAGAGQMAGGLVGGMPGPTASDAQAWGDDTGAATSAGVGLSGTTDDPGIPGSGGGWGQGIADVAAQAQAARDAAATAFREEEANRMFGRDRTAMSQAEKDALEGWDGGAQATGQDIDIDDENEDYSGLPTGMTAEQTNMIVAGLKDAEKGKGFAYALNEMARRALGLPPSTPESRMRDALTNYDEQGKQEAREMDVSTGEDDRTRMEKIKAIGNFRKQYKWAKDMSAKEIQAYMDNPALLKLKISNEQMRSMDPKTMTANDIRQLWSPAMSA